jgi:hypothetical protein
MVLNCIVVLRTTSDGLSGAGPLGFHEFCAVVALLRRFEVVFSSDRCCREKAFHTDRIPRTIVITPVVKSNLRQQLQWDRPPLYFSPEM